MPDPEYIKKQGKAPRRRTRQDQLIEQESALAELPDVTHGQQVIQWWHEIGPTESGMNGPAPLSWQEINAWKQATGTAATAEELAMIRQLSREYVAQYNRSDNPQEPSPTRPKAVDQELLAAQVKSALRGAAKKRKG